MKTLTLTKLLGLLLLLLQLEVQALVPLESAVLGKINKDIQYDPLDYVFAPRTQKYSAEDGARQELKAFTGFIHQGENLQNSCANSFRNEYRDSWRRKVALTSVASTLQYIGLDVTTRAIGKYAQVLEFSQDEYNNLVDRLVGNYCSKNLTVMSLKLLRDNLQSRYQKDNDFALPTTGDNPYFPEALKKWSESMRAREQEMVAAVKVFRALCSWGGDEDDFRLMTPFLKDQYIMSFVNEQILSQAIKWKADTNQFYVEQSSNTVQVLCRDLICRKVTRVEFDREFPLSAGSTGLASDLSRMYCHNFRDLDYKFKNQEATIKKWMNKQTLDEERFMVSSLISLFTHIPDFLMNAPSYKDFIDIAKSNVDNTWTNWAHKSNEAYTNELYYEESLHIEVADRQHYFFYTKPDFKVMLDVHLGELDKTFVVNDKVGFSYPLKVNKTFLKWIRQEYINANTNEKTDKVLAEFSQHLFPQIEKIRSRLLVAPWNEGLERLVASELLEQLRFYRGNYFGDFEASDVFIPVEFRYGLFALKYIDYRAKTKAL